MRCCALDGQQRSNSRVWNSATEAIHPAVTPDLNRGREMYSLCPTSACCFHSSQMQQWHSLARKMRGLWLWSMGANICHALPSRIVIRPPSPVQGTIVVDKERGRRGLRFMSRSGPRCCALRSNSPASRQAVSTADSFMCVVVALSPSEAQTRGRS